MAIADICVRDVVIVEKTATIQHAAQLMRQHHVGCLIVTEDSAGQQIPTSIITDRDIVVSVIAPGLDPRVFTVGDLTREGLVTVDQEQGVFETIEQMRKNGVRRMPVVGRGGGLVGIVSVDDVVQLLAEELGDIAKLISREQKQERQARV